MIEIIYDDSNFMVINKPPGMPVHATLDKKRKNISDELIKQTGLRNLKLIHRLDSETSGLLLFSKHSEAHQALENLFKHRTIEKQYWAIVHGIPLLKEQELKNFLKKSKVKGKELNLVVKSGGDLALTSYEVIKELDHYSLLQCSIKTGRMHQIRSQLSFIGHPLLGDSLYGNDSGIQLKLHARRLKFLDPFSRVEREFIAPEPHDFFVTSSNYEYYKFYKPFNVLCQFTKEGNERTLADFNLPKEVYPAGRLDKDSEGLLLLTNDGPLIHRLLDPKFDHEKTYHVQVEGIPTEESLDLLRRGGFKIQDYKTRPAKVRIIPEPNFPPRHPPIRFRANIPTTWLEVVITEGKNRQVRRMTAAIGFPTLRLVRVRIGKLELENLTIGEFKKIPKTDL